jgi:hypothetical protein
LPPQQVPGQHDAPLWQQLAPQQFPWQHFAPGLQQAPVAANAETASRDIAIRARTLDFMEKLLSVSEKGSRTRSAIQPAQNQRDCPER